MVIDVTSGATARVSRIETGSVTKSKPLAGSMRSEQPLHYHQPSRRGETPSKLSYGTRPSSRAANRVAAARKLDLSKAAPKVDTGRTKRYTPSGGNVVVPFGRMPRGAGTRY
jgi:hypothetical protein